MDLYCCLDLFVLLVSVVFGLLLFMFGLRLLLVVDWCLRVVSVTFGYFGYFDVIVCYFVCCYLVVCFVV